MHIACCTLVYSLIGISLFSTDIDDQRSWTRLHQDFWVFLHIKVGPVPCPWKTTDNRRNRCISVGIEANRKHGITVVIYLKKCKTTNVWAATLVLCEELVNFKKFSMAEYNFNSVKKLFYCLQMFLLWSFSQCLHSKLKEKHVLKVKENSAETGFKWIIVFQYVMLQHSNQSTISSVSCHKHGWTDIIVSAAPQ